MERIGGETIALYADLRERLEAFEAMRSIASLPGELTTKTVKGIVYHYFQATLPGGRTQIYIGPDSDEVRRLIDARKSGEQEVFADEKMFRRLAAQIIAGGVAPIMPAMARVISRLADSGVFRVGGVLVGTFAYQVLGPHLGVIWGSGSRMTQDIDLASDNRIAIAVPELKADVPAAIESLQMGFFPVPRLSRKEPSTSYTIRGKTLRLDLLTPKRRGATAPVFIRRLNASATPLKYLDYLIEEPINAVMLAGNPCLVKAPQPARFALHKLIVSQERDATATDKKRKDLLQAGNLINLLKEDRPGDIELARENLAKRGTSWIKKIEAACTEANIRL
ncbi:MAG TPA: nucleotidyltransferase domain-containing protein [Geobacteraceae bacterium]|nr:nucleotidyltransferase domain-containing protein [Geobacteraceae bacterium]